MERITCIPLLIAMLSSGCSNDEAMDANQHAIAELNKRFDDLELSSRAISHQIDAGNANNARATSKTAEQVAHLHSRIDELLVALGRGLNVTDERGQVRVKVDQSGMTIFDASGVERARLVYVMESGSQLMVGAAGKDGYVGPTLFARATDKRVNVDLAMSAREHDTRLFANDTGQTGLVIFDQQSAVRYGAIWNPADGQMVIGEK